MTAAMVGVVLLVSGGPLEAGQPVDYSLQTLTGEHVGSEQTKGERTVVYFWATWCSACKVTTGSVEGFAERHPNTRVLAVSPESPAVIAAWNKGRSSPLKLVAEGGSMLRKLGVHAFPTTVILGADGRVEWNRSGVLVPGELDVRF